MTNSETAKKENSRTLYLPFRKIIAPMIVLSLLCSIVLFAVLMVISLFRSANNLIRITDRAIDTYEEDRMGRDMVEMTLDDYYISAVNYLSYFQNVNGIADEDLPALALDHFSPCSGYVVSRDGSLLYQNTYAETQSDSDLQQLKTLLPLTDNAEGFAKWSSDSSRLFLQKLPSGNTLVLSAPHNVYKDYLNYYDAIYSPFTSTPPLTGSYQPNNYSTILFTLSSDDTIESSNISLTREDYADRIQIQNLFSFQRGEALYTCARIVWNGHRYFGVHAPIPYEDRDIFCCISPYTTVFEEVLKINLIVSTAFALLLFLAIFYIFHLHQYRAMQEADQGYSDQAIQRKERVVLTLTVALTMAVSYFTQTLLPLSAAVFGNRETLNSIREAYEDANGGCAIIRDQQTQMRIDYLNAVSDFIGFRSEPATAEILSDLSDIFNFNYLILYDMEGKELLASNSYINLSLPESDSDPDFVFRPLLNGEKYVIGESVIDPYERIPFRKIGTPVKERSGTQTGALIGYYSEHAINVLFEKASISQILRNTKIADVAEYASVEIESGQVTSFPDDSAIGASASEIGFTEKMFEPGFYGKVLLHNNQYYINGTTISDQYVFILNSPAQIYATRIPYTLFAGVLFLLAALFLKALLNPKRSDYDRVYCGTAEIEQEIARTAKETRNTERQSQETLPLSAVFRARNGSDPRWIRMTPEDKTAQVLKVISAILAAVLVLMLVLSDYFAPQSLLMQIAKGNWEKGFNVFAVSACLLVILCGFVAVHIIIWLLSLLKQISGPRGKTVCSLMENSIEYISVIVIFYLCLVNLGTNIQSLVASLGLLTLIIGMGAKDLITDIVAGLFIIFEGDFHVGDIVDINGYRGMVTEIGLRTTRVSGWDRNVKVLNNRNVTNVINLSLRSSFAIVDFAVPYDASIPQVRAILEEAFKDYKTKYPFLISTPSFKGINRMTGGKIECRVMAEVPELHRGALERDLSVDIKEILEKNNIRLT